MNIRSRARRWEMAMGVGLFVAVLTGALMNRTADGLSDSLVRLHVIANSNEDGDQAVKLLVRDKVLDYMTPILSETNTRQQAELLIREHLTDIEEQAGLVLRENGYNLPVKAALERVGFPTKEYDGFSLPAGNYEALRVVIGEGQGANWWCVVFPPLCTAAGESVAKTATDGGLSPGQIHLITEDSETYVIAFKCLEWWDKFKSIFQ